MEILKKAKGVVLLRKNFRSTSKLIDFYSQEYGRLLLLAKGVREEKNYLNGSLEPLNCCEIIFYKKDNRLTYFVKDAIILYNFPSIIKEYQKYSQIFYLNKFLSLILPIEEKNEKIFRLYLFTLFFINFSPFDKIKNIVLSFYLKTIAHIGFQPSLLECLICRKKIFGKENIFFNIEKGGILCSNCHKENKNSFLIAKKTLEDLQRLFFDSYLKLLDYQIIPETEKVIKLYLNYHLFGSLTLKFFSL